MIVRVARFGGERTADPPAWGLWSGKQRDKVTIFFGIEDLLLGEWWVNPENGGSDFWRVPDLLVPDTVWVALAKWRLTND